MGRRIEKNVDGVVTRYLYSNEGLIGEYDANNNLKKSYGWMPNGIWGTDPLYMTQNNQSYFYHNDALGTPQKMTDASGAVVWSATYTAFGEATIDPSSTVTSNLRFAGQYFDSETGVNYNLFRVYDPKTGTYISKDPIGFAAGDTNLYRYVFNRPTRYTDPLGLICSYGQNSGWIVCADDNSGKVYLVDKGYSGTGEGRNVGWKQDVKDVGPIPGGDWQVGPAIDHETLGKYTLPLTPLFLNDVFDTKRDKYPGAFAVHGNNLRDDASKGCMILKRESRKAIPSKEIIRVGL